MSEEKETCTSKYFICYHCGEERPCKIEVMEYDNTIAMEYLIPKQCPFGDDTGEWVEVEKPEFEKPAGVSVSC